MPRQKTAKTAKTAGNGTKTTTRKPPAKAAAATKKATRTAKATATTRKKTAKKSTGTRRSRMAESELVISADERRQWIAEAAYLRAEARGFVGGDTTRDWLEAESEVDARISAHN
jgi:hypothetical protein